ncbi:transmembrane protein 127-like [Tribolium madens]|uniref:transmembrane protein 127-like n=1 Tax=Tribolium madens TaxID=41895 RepID=UPI001CF750F2|nr:transmembrane protein 127-like [Tribolium madens]
MPRSFLQILQSKNDDRNLISATFHMITITLISMSLVDLTWFTISGDVAVPNLTLGQFFWFGYTNSVNYSDYDFINSTIVNLMRTTILLCFMAIIFSLAGFFLDIMGPKSILYRMIRRYAVAGTCTVLWIMAIVSISYYIVLLLEDSVEKTSLKVETTVSYGDGFYLLASAGGVSLIGIFYNLIVANHPVGYYREDDRCLIGYDDGFDTFNSPTPPPPYNVPPPPYTP